MPMPLPAVTTGARFDEAFYDVPNQRPDIPVALPAVSVRNQQILLDVTDELVGGELPLLCDVDVRVSLRADQRGIHMSRIQTALQTAVGPSLTDFAVDIAKRIRDSQQQETAEVRLRARVPLSTRTRVTGLSSPDTVEMSAIAIAGPEPVVSHAVAATNITACPCMQGYALTDLIDHLDLRPEDGIELLRRVPIATHSQRGRVRLSVGARDPQRLPGFADLYRILADRTTLTQELLKRPDEYDLVRRAHLTPQFVEDVVRSVAGGLIRSLGPDRDDLVVDVTAESYESIHGHDIFAQLRAPGHDLARVLEATTIS
jgi:GTP cyclohydrolase FolE2